MEIASLVIVNFGSFFVVVCSDGCSENKKDADDNRRNLKKIENIPSKNKIEKHCQDCIKEIEKVL